MKVCICKTCSPEWEPYCIDEFSDQIIGLKNKIDKLENFFEDIISDNILKGEIEDEISDLESELTKIKSQFAEAGQIDDFERELKNEI